MLNHTQTITAHLRHNLSDTAAEWHSGRNGAVAQCSAADSLFIAAVLTLPY